MGILSKFKGFFKKASTWIGIGLLFIGAIVWCAFFCNTVPDCNCERYLPDERASYRECMIQCDERL